ncbi:MAG: hypothetical protein ACK4M7_04480, partial [Burkholderiales bacterium]
MKMNPFYVKSYNSLNRTSPSRTEDKKDTLTKLGSHPDRAKILAHLINFKMSRTRSWNDINKQNYELEKIKSILEADERSPFDKKISFDEIQHFVRNKSVIFQKQLPSHFKQAINDFIRSHKGKHITDFLEILDPKARYFLQDNQIEYNDIIKNAVSSGPLDKVSESYDYYEHELGEDITLEYFTSNIKKSIESAGLEDLELPWTTLL